MNHAYSFLLPRWLPRPLAALGLLLATAGAAQAQAPATFASAATYATGTVPQGIVLADVNGDGRPDLINANSNSNNIGVLLGSATTPGTFPATATFYNSGGSFPVGVGVGDVNGDGRPDIVVANSAGNTVGVLLNLAAAPGTFGAATVYGSGSSVPRGLALTDVNRDGRLDIIVGGDGNLGVLLNSAATPGTFGTAATYSTGTSADAIAVGDVNGDGRPDVAVSNFNGGTIDVLLNSASTPGTFPAVASYNTGGSTVRGITLGDVNGDGRPDIVTGNQDTNNISVLLNQAASPGTFGAAALYPSVGAGPNGVAVLDVNGDGRPDIISANYAIGNSTTVSVLLNSATTLGTFLGATTYGSGGNGPIELALGDVNGDGKPDIATTNVLSSTIGVLLNTTVLAIPTITMFSPTTGPVGTQVTITGTNFTGTTAVRFNGTAASSFIVNSPTSITAVVAAGTTTGAVSVITPSGTATSSTNFIVRVAPTTVADVYSTQQGVLLTGNVLTNDIGTNSRAILINRPTRGTLVLNPNGSFTYQPVATYSGPDSFTYYACDPAEPLLCGNSVTVSITILNSPPTITMFSPATGPAGTQVIITGTNFTTATAVRFNGTAASSFVVNSATSITAVVAAGTTTGLVSVTTLTGTATSSTNFVVRVPPTTVADTYTTQVGVLLTGNVLTNDIGTNPRAILINRPTRGTLVLNPNGSFTYQPNAGYVGSDSFTYYACDPAEPLLCGNPVTVSITIVNTVANVSALYQTGDFGQPNDNQVRPFLQLVNNGTTAVPYQQLTVRYWLTPENFMGQLVTPVDWVKLGTGLVSARYVQLATPRQGAFGYIEYSFSAAAGSLAAGTNSGDIYGKAYKPDYSNFNETDDWSYQTSSSFTTNSHVTVYQNGTLIDGTEPPAVASTTNIRVLAGNQDISPTTSYINVTLQVANSGNRPVNYSDLTVRYYFTRDGATAIVPTVDYAKLGASNISVRYVALATPLNGADGYLEIGFSAALGVFYPFTNTDNIQFKIRKSDYTAFTQTNDYSFSSSSAVVQQPRVPAYLNGARVFGTEPSDAIATMARDSQPASASASASASAGGATIVAAATTPLELALSGSPNPFGEQLMLRFALPTAQAYTLAVYDVQGRLVQQVASGQAEAGQAQELAVPTQTYAAGLYLVRLTTATGTQQLKLIKQ